MKSPDHWSLAIPKPPGIEIFGPEPWEDWYEGDPNWFYWIVYLPPKLSKEKRIQLKSLGWKLERHPRTNKEIWFFPPRFWDKTTFKSRQK